MQCPITGQPCDKGKHVHFLQVINNTKKEGMVCSDCSAMKGGMSSLLGSFGNLFGVPGEAELVPLPMAAETAYPGLDFWKQFFGGTLVNPAHQGVVCTGCNLSLADIRQLGRLGCPKCYESFREYLEPVLQRSHEGGLQHIGKKPKNTPTFRHHNIEDLKAKLAEAVEAERFEDAAVLRDAIKRLENHIKKEDPSRQQDQTPNTPGS